MLERDGPRNSLPAAALPRAAGPVTLQLAMAPSRKAAGDSSQAVSAGRPVSGWMSATVGTLAGGSAMLTARSTCTGGRAYGRVE